MNSFDIFTAAYVDNTLAPLHSKSRLARKALEADMADPTIDVSAAFDRAANAHEAFLATVAGLLTVTGASDKAARSIARSLLADHGGDFDAVVRELRIEADDLIRRHHS